MSRRKKDWAKKYTIPEETKESRFETIDEEEESPIEPRKEFNDNLDVYKEKTRRFLKLSRNSRAFMEDDISAALATRRLSQEETVIKQEDAFNQLLFGPSAAGRRRRSSFALPIEESTGRPALPNASKLSKTEPVAKEEPIEQESLLLVANSFKSFRMGTKKQEGVEEQDRTSLFKAMSDDDIDQQEFDTSRKTSKTSFRLSDYSDNRKSSISTSARGSLKPTDGDLSRTNSARGSLKPTSSFSGPSSTRDSLKPVPDAEMQSLPGSNSARGSLMPAPSFSSPGSTKGSLRPSEVERPSFFGAPRISIIADDDPTEELNAPKPIKLEERVSFLKTLQQNSKLESSPSFVSTSKTPRHSLTKRNTDRLLTQPKLETAPSFIDSRLSVNSQPWVDSRSSSVVDQRFSLAKRNTDVMRNSITSIRDSTIGVVPAIFVETVFATPPRNDDSVPSASATQGSTPAAKKETPHVRKELKSVVLDSRILEREPSWEDLEEEYPSVKGGKVVFSKAPTGRLNEKKTPRIKPNRSISKVVLVGKKVDVETADTPEILVEEETKPEVLTPFYSQSTSEKDIAEPEEDTKFEPNHEPNPQEEREHELDVGFYQSITEVDAVLSHFSEMLEERKKKIQTGITESDIITDTEVPIFLNEIRSASPARLNEETNEANQLSTISEIEMNVVEDGKPPVPPSLRKDSNMTQTKRVPVPPAGRPRTAGENSVRSHSTRSIKSASALSRSTGTRTTISSCSCTCSTGSCSVCLSRATSALESSTRISSAKTSSSKETKELPKKLATDFAPFGAADPLGHESLLDYVPQEQNTSGELQISLEPSDVEQSVGEVEEKVTKSKKKINVSGLRIANPLAESEKKLEESVAPVKKRVVANAKGFKARKQERIENHRKSITDVIIERVAKSQQVKRSRAMATGNNSWFKMEPVQPVAPTMELSISLPPIQEDEPPHPIERMDSLDFQVMKLIEQYELKKIQQEESNKPKSRRPSSILSEEQSLREQTEMNATGEDSDDYITEEDEIQPSKPLPSKGKRFWYIIKKDIQKKKLINTLKGSVEFEADINAKQQEELQKDAEEEVETSAEEIHEVIPVGILKDGRVDPKSFYQIQRRTYDMEKYPSLYYNKKFNPETNQLELSPTKRPTIGLSPEADRTKLLPDDDMDAIYRFYIRHGLQINGFATTARRSLYEVVHNLDRRKAGLTGMDRVKYPTFDDPGPPLDATGTPILDETMLDMAKEVDLNGELEKLDILINESQTPNPIYYRKRGILLARLEKFNRAMEDLDTAIQLEPNNTDGLWHRSQLYLRYNDASSALADLDTLTENNKAHVGAFQAKARIYQALGMYKYASSNYSSVIRHKPDNPDAYFNRALLFEIEDEVTLANEDYRAVRLLDPTNEVAIHNLAMYSFQKQLWSDCISEFSKLIMFNPENADYFMYRGRAYASMSFFVEALEDLTQAIRLNPDKSVYYFHRGCLLREQNFPKALQDLSVSLLLDDTVNNSDAYFYRAQLLQKMRQNDLAILDYHSCIELNPKKAKALLNLGILYMRHSRLYSEALNYINKAIAADPISLRGYISRGELYEAMYREAMLKMANSHQKRAMRTNRMDHAARYVALAVKDYSRAIHIRPSNYILFLYRGKMLLKQGKVDEATADFHTAFDLNTSIAQTFIQRALILSFQRKHKQIIEEYDERKKRYNINSDDPTLLLLVAKARIRDGDFKGALEDLNLAGEQATNDPQISLQKGICHEYLKNWYEASLEFSKCLERIPTFSKAYYHRGICKLAEGDDSGEQDLNRAIELEPKYFDAYITRAAYFESKGQYGKSISDCDEALRIEPISIRAHILRGSCKCKIGLFPMAVTDFTKAVSIDKTSHFAFYNRAIAYQAAEDYNNAMKDYSIVLLLDDNVDAYRNRALLYWKLGDNDNALLDFIEAKRIAPNNAKIRCLYALSLHKIGRFQESLYEYTQAIMLDGKLIEAILGRGNVYSQLGDLEKSRQDYCRVIHMHPRHANTLVNIAYTYQAEKSLKMAWKYFTMSFTVDPNCTAGLEGRALINLAMENPFAAYLDITRAIEIEPHNAQFLTNRGVIFEALKDDVSALQSYKLATEKDPSYALAYFNAANHYLKQHHWEKAIEYYGKAIQIDPSDCSPYMNRAIAYSMLKQYSEAKDDLLKTIGLDGDSTTAYFNLGYVYTCLGDLDQAEAAFEKVIQLSPDDPLAYQCRAETRTMQFKWTEAMEDYAAQIAIE